MEDLQKLTVIGEGVIRVAPDRAQVTLGVVTEDESVSQAQQTNNDLFEAIITGLNTLGIQEEDIRTTTYRIEPRYDFVEGVQKFRGYEVTHMIQIIVEDLTQTGVVIDVAVENGANVISSIDFTVEETASIYQQALQLALGDAKNKALAMTESTNVTLNDIPIKMTERSDGGQARFYDGVMMSAQATPIQAGTISILATVEVVYTYGT
ncbi:SIMPL domain-containing protein [Bacillus sp. FJAT-45037]|uniref:SIMPL domain-containing protein n=1 Tax=Bacillus sp. FJAT-45037 TaxID=2011007 RepID=UPI0012FDBC6B|nr:SIMPL domain-containing protein [Bacillus sp. FJAT-45037]